MRSVSPLRHDLDCRTVRGHPTAGSSVSLRRPRLERACAPNTKSGPGTARAVVVPGFLCWVRTNAAERDDPADLTPRVWSSVRTAGRLGPPHDWAAGTGRPRARLGRLHTARATAPAATCALAQPVE